MENKRREEVRREIAELVGAARRGEYKAASDVRDAVRTSAKALGMSCGHIHQLMLESMT